MSQRKALEDLDNLFPGLKSGRVTQPTTTEGPAPAPSAPLVDPAEPKRRRVMIRDTSALKPAEAAEVKPAPDVSRLLALNRSAEVQARPAARPRLRLMESQGFGGVRTAGFQAAPRTEDALPAIVQGLLHRVGIRSGFPAGPRDLDFFVHASDVGSAAERALVKIGGWMAARHPGLSWKLRVVERCAHEVI